MCCKRFVVKHFQCAYFFFAQENSSIYRSTQLVHLSSIKFKPFWSWWKTFTFLRKKNQAKDRKCRSHWTTILNEILNMFPSKMKIVDCWSNFGQSMKNGKTNIFRKRNNQPNYTVCCPKEHMNFHYGYVFFFNKKNRT